MRLVAENLSFSYRDSSTLFTNVSLHIDRGERVALLGANAVGKTTLLSMLAGLLSPQIGRVFVQDGEHCKTVDGVGLILQNPEHQLLAATVELELAMGLELRGIESSEIRNRVDDMLEHFELRQLKDYPPRHLSGGQKQRVALAALLICEPTFLLLDEPDSYLDAPSRHALLAAVDAAAQRCGVLWTVSSARKIPPVDRVLLMTANGLAHYESKLASPNQ